MALVLVELELTNSTADTLRDQAAAAVVKAGGRVVETQVVSDLGRLYVIANHDSAGTLELALRAAGLPVAEVAPVRLVGAPPSDNGTRHASHLVEWDLPGTLSMDDYLARKAAKTPLYDTVPETTFLRTYVHEDMVKCVCLYDAPDEAAVRRARAAVSAPVDRLSRLNE